jgi:hypothetical protein
MLFLQVVFSHLALLASVPCRLQGVDYEHECQLDLARQVYAPRVKEEEEAQSGEKGTAH